MNNEKNDGNQQPTDLDELILDRLVDNDLSNSEYREVLRLVEEKPDGWRKLAMAFLESQAFEKELSALHDDVGAGSLLVDDPFRQAEIHVANKTNSTDESPKNQSINAASRPTESRPGGQASLNSERRLEPGFWFSLRRALPAIAACFAIAFTIGLYMRELQQNGNSQTADSMDKGNPTVDSGFIELVSNDPNGRVQTPVYNHQKFDPQGYAKDVDKLKPRLQEVVRRSGWNADERTHVVPIKDGTGNKIIVPLKEIKLTPKSFEDYQ